MRSKFADICFNTLTKDDRGVVMIGDISHFLLRNVESKFPNSVSNADYDNLIILKQNE